VPDIILSVRRIERFSVVVGPTGIISIVAIFFPQHMAAWETSNPRKYGSVNPVAPHVSLLPRMTCGSSPGHDKKAAAERQGTRGKNVVSLTRSYTRPYISKILNINVQFASPVSSILSKWLKPMFLVYVANPKITFNYSPPRLSVLGMV